MGCIATQAIRISFLHCMQARTPRSRRIPLAGDQVFPEISQTLKPGSYEVSAGC